MKEQPRAASLVGYGLTTPRGQVFQPKEENPEVLEHKGSVESLSQGEENNISFGSQTITSGGLQGETVISQGPFTTYINIPHEHHWISDGVHSLAIKSGSGVSGANSSNVKQVLVLHCSCSSIKCIELLSILYATEQ